MWTARLSERHLTLVFHLLGTKQEGISREEMAANRKDKHMRHLDSDGSYMSMKRSPCKIWIGHRIMEHVHHKEILIRGHPVLEILKCTVEPGHIFC